MALELVTDLRDADQKLLDTKARGLVTSISTRADMFRDETFFLKDDVVNQLHAFSKRPPGLFFEWSWGTSPTKPMLQPDLELMIKNILVLGFSEASKRWGPIPFSFIYNEKCPTVAELSSGKTDLSVCDAIVNTVNALVPGSAIRRPGRDKMTFTVNKKEISYGEVYGHSKIVRLEDQAFDFSRGTPGGVRIG